MREKIEKALEKIRAGLQQACPKKIMQMKKNKVSIDYSRCISCFCCLEVCPASAIKIKKSFFARLIGL